MYRFAPFLVLLHGLIAQTSPTNLDFEAGGAVGGTPRGWSTFSSPSTLAYRVALSSSGCLEGLYCALMTSPSNGTSSSFGDLSETVPSNSYRGRTVMFRVAVRVESPDMRAILWLRVDRADGSVALILNSPSITATDWRYYQISGQVSTDSVSLVFGVLNFATSRVWVDGGSFLVSDAASQEGPRAVSDTGEANLTAFAKVLGYVRHFHPSDQVPLVDWDSFAAYGARTVESAGTPEDLASALETLFDPIAPTLRVFATGTHPSLPAELQPASTAGLQAVRWNNFGVYLSASSNIYTSTRETAPASAIPAGFQNPGQPFEADIGRGLSVWVPLTVYADSGGTLPHRPPPGYHCCAWGADDRATRLGGVTIAWNVAQHFYPYFDVVQTDWPAALAAALRSAATDGGGDDYFITLSRMWAALHDGHGWVWGPQSNLMAPLVWDWVENQLVVTVVKPGAAAGVAKGDRVLRINGKPAEDALASRQELISGATPQWILYRALLALAQCPNQAKTMQLDIEPYASPGASRSIQFTCTSDSSWREPRPAVVTELEPGIMYVDVNNLTEAIWNANVASVAGAKGVVFDLRGYPQIVTYLQHLAAGTLNSAQWHIPTPAKPDRVDLTFHQDASWALPPLLPSIAGRRVFLTDGEAVSFAESVMGIVENYRLTEIVGSTTAGTNGNINYIDLPGGFRFGFTGMKVLKNDGSQHHGVGIHATIPASRTRKGIAEGRDEVLARGVEVVKGPPPGPAPAMGAVVNAASFVEGPVAPGEIVTIFGTDLGPAQLAKTTYDGSGYLGTWAGETRVFFDGIQAPLVYASSTQVSAIVPYQAAGSTRIRVEYQLRGSDARTVQVTGAAPGIFAAIVNQDNSFNSAGNPAGRGEVVTLFATGTGATSPPGVTGKLPPQWRAPVGDVVVTFGGIAGELQFAGEIGAGLLQVNVKVPAGAATGSAVPVSIAVGGISSPARATIAVK